MVPRISRAEGLRISVLCLAGFYFLFWKLGTPALYDLDEGGYAEIAREMLVLNDWIIPRINFVRLLDKPPLLYWLTACSFKLFGISEFSARLPVALSTMGCMMLCYLLGKRFFGSLAGFLAALIFASSAGTTVFDFGRQLQPDMVFVFFLTAAFGAFLLGYFERENKQRYFLSGYAALALAVMTKGLIGPIFPFLALAGYLCLTREYGMIRRMYLLRGAVVFVLLALPWHLAAEWRSPGFLKFYFLDVHILRFFDEGLIASTMSSLSLPAFLGITSMLIYPWVVFFPGILPRDFPFRSKQWDESGRAALWLWLWVGAVIFFFAVSSFRLYIYGLPVLPPLAILGGRFWAIVMTADSKARPPSSSGRNEEGSVPAARDDSAGASISAGASSGHAFIPAARLHGAAGGRTGILAGVVLLVLISAGVFLASQVPESWREWLGRESFVMIDAGVTELASDADPGAGILLPSWEELSPLWISGGLILMAGSLLAFLAALLNRLSWVFVFVLVTMFPIRYCALVGMEIFEPYRSTKSLAASIASTFRPGDRIVKDGRYEEIASVGFYMGRKVYLVNGIRNDLVFGARYPEAAEVFMDEEEFFRTWNSGARVYLLTDYPYNRSAERREFYSKLNLHYLDRSGVFQLFTNHPP